MTGLFRMVRSGLRTFRRFDFGGLIALVKLRLLLVGGSSLEQLTEEGDALAFVAEEFDANNAAGFGGLGVSWCKSRRTSPDALMPLPCVLPFAEY